MRLIKFDFWIQMVQKFILQDVWLNRNGSFVKILEVLIGFRNPGLYLKQSYFGLFENQLLRLQFILLNLPVLEILVYVSALFKTADDMLFRSREIRNYKRFDFLLQFSEGLASNHHLIEFEIRQFLNVSALELTLYSHTLVDLQQYVITITVYDFTHRLHRGLEFHAVLFKHYLEFYEANSRSVRTAYLFYKKLKGFHYIPKLTLYCNVIT